MKVNIFFPFQEKSSGGGHQFLKALRLKLRERCIYEEDPIQADCLLFNASPAAFIEYFWRIIEFKRLKPNLKVVVRIDGPVALTRGRDTGIDRIFFDFCESIADGVIFQSKWSKQKCLQLGMKEPKYATSIINAPDSAIFYPREKKKTAYPLKVIITSWSDNLRKGFSDYAFLDKLVDPQKIEVHFVGNSPVSFANIHMHGAMSSEDLANFLREGDLYLTASQCDPCSNALIEAMHCGLPAVAYNDGGHPEIVGNGGLLYSARSELLPTIEYLCDNLGKFQTSINLPKMDDVADKYIEFIAEILQLPAKKPKLLQYELMAFLKIYFHRLREKIFLKLNR